MTACVRAVQETSASPRSKSPCSARANSSQNTNVTTRCRAAACREAASGATNRRTPAFLKNALLKKKATQLTSRVCQLFKVPTIRSLSQIAPKIRKARVIIVTGTPSTGKTTLAKQIEKQYRLTRLDVNAIIKQHHLREGYDQKNKCWIVDEKRFTQILEKIVREKRKNKQKIVIDSHLSHCLNPQLVDLCLVTRCDLDELYQRLKKKAYPKNKIEENMECEIMEVCLQEAYDKKHTLVVVDTTKKRKEKRVKK